MPKRRKKAAKKTKKKAKKKAKKRRRRRQYLSILYKKTLLITFCVRGVFFYSSIGSVSSASLIGSSFGKSLEKSTNIFVSKISLEKESFINSGINKELLPVKNIRNISKKDMVHNNYCPNIEVNPETYEVKADGEIITCEPAETLPLAQRYFMY